MLLKREVEFLIFPRVATIRFSFKGQYRLKFAIVNMPAQNRPNYAYPQIINSESKTKSIRNEFNSLRDTTQSCRLSKKACIQSSKTHLKFCTQTFRTNFQQDQILLNKACRFKLQYNQSSKKIDKYKTYLLIEIVNYRQNITKNKHEMIIQRSSRTVCEKYIHINKIFDSLSDFCQIDLTESDYFCALSMYFGSVNYGYKIRKNKCTLFQFMSQQMMNRNQDDVQMRNNELNSRICAKNRVKVVPHHNKVFDSPKDMGKAIKTAFRKIVTNTKQYYFISICQAKNEYLRLLALFKDIHYSDIQQFESSPSRSWIKSIPQLLNSQDLVQYYQTDDNELLYLEIYKQSQSIYRNLKKLWQQFAESSLQINLNDFISSCKKQATNQLQKWFKIAVYVPKFDQTRKTIINTYKRTRQKLLYNCPFYPKQWIHFPLMTVKKTNSTIQKSINKKNSLFVLLHGFQGSRYDLDKIAFFISKYKEKAQILLCKSLEQVFNDDIEVMAERVADEIANEIRYYFGSIDRVHFIGFSLGGVVLRAALKYLEQFRQKFGIYVSLSSPHLGIFESANRLLKLGVWYLSKFEKVQSIKQINTGRDLQTSEKSYLKKLSEDHRLSWFRKAIFVSSREDEFVPHYSASIANSTDFHHPQIQQIATNILKNAQNTEQWQIWFNTQQSQAYIDSIIGRQVHMQFLNNDMFLDIFFHNYSHEF